MIGGWRRRSGAEAAAAARIESQGEGRYVVVGELTFTSVDALLAQRGLLFAGAGSIEIDLAGVEKADSAGLALLVEWLAQARRAGRQLTFQRIPGQIERMAHLSGLDDLLPTSGDAAAQTIS